VPQPCSQPLKINPFESYRDPVTGQWKVQYPASAVPPVHEEIVLQSTAVVMAQPSQAASAHKSVHSISEEDKLKLMPKRRRWQETGRPQKVASKEVA